MKEFCHIVHSFDCLGFHSHNKAGFYFTDHHAILHQRYYTCYDYVSTTGVSLLATRILNDKLMQLERSFIDPMGLPDNPLLR